MRLSIRDLIRDIGDREKVSTHLSDYPLLLLLLYNFWFRLVFVILLLAGMAFPFCVVHIWRTSPAGFEPVIKVSVISLVQAWSLQRTARQQVAAKQWDDAILSWQTALAHNPASTNTVRALLETGLQMDKIGSRQNLMANQSIWLLRLGGTNTADVELVTRVFERMDLPDYTVFFLRPFEDHLTPVMQATYLKALFNLGDMDQFHTWMDKSAALIDKDAELRLYRAAYQAGWGEPGVITAGRETLAEALEHPTWRTLANRLQLKVSVQNRDLPAFERALHTLEDWRMDRPIDHVHYWRMLADAGRKAEALAAASSFPNAPTTAQEAILMAQTLHSLGRKDHAIEILQNNSRNFSYSDSLWIYHASLLLDAKRWEDLRTLALTIRQESNVREQLAGFSYFLEGRAELGLERKALASEAFRTAVDRGVKSPRVGLYVGGELTRLGYPELGSQILTPLMKESARTPAYWQQMFAAANALRNASMLVLASSNYHQLYPRNYAAINNYAAALLCSRQRPEEAVRLTMELVQMQPNSSGAAINHALALCMNRRVDEAEKLLKKLSPDRLSPEEASSYFLGWFQVYFERGQWDDARRTAEKIDREQLFDSENLWFKECLEKATPPPKEG